MLEKILFFWFFFECYKIFFFVLYLKFSLNWYYWFYIIKNWCGKSMWKILEFLFNVWLLVKVTVLAGVAGVKFFTFNFWVCFNYGWSYTAMLVLRTSWNIVAIPIKIIIISISQYLSWLFIFHFGKNALLFEELHFNCGKHFMNAYLKTFLDFLMALEGGMWCSDT